eukprot:10501039-Karenia_brevis.AAC.1
MGDFNFEPSEISGKQDPRALCRKSWDRMLKDHRMHLVNPSGLVGGTQEELSTVELPLQAKS